MGGAEEAEPDPGLPARWTGEQPPLPDAGLDRKACVAPSFYGALLSLYCLQVGKHLKRSNFLSLTGC